MSAEYAVKCECGRTHHVAAGSAGMRLACGCGRPFDVPSLHVLRLQAGEPAVSAELVIEAMLRDGQLPEETDCLHCGMPTEEVCYADVICERQEVRKPPWGIDWSGLLFGRLTLVREGEDKLLGRDIRYRLPLRICPDCASRLRTAAWKDALRRVPVYARLLEKYSHAEVTFVR